MSDDPARLYSFEEWRSLTPEQRRDLRRDRRLAVDRARREHKRRMAELNDSLTVERFGHPEDERK